MLPLNLTSTQYGIALRIFSGLLFVAMTLCVKAVGQHVPLGETVFFRSAFALFPLFGFLWVTGDFPAGLKTKNPFGHVLRCVLGISALFTFFATLRFLPLAEATTLSYLAPALVVLLAAFFLNERIHGRSWVGVFLGLAGALVLAAPEFTAHADVRFLIGLALGFTTAVLMAGALIQIRRLVLLGENTGAIALYFAITGAVAGLVTLPFGWTFPTGAQLSLLIGAGLAGGFAHIFMTLSYKYAEASAMAPFEYLSILWAASFGYLLFHEVPSATLALAAPLIVAGAVYAAAGSDRRKRNGVQTTPKKGG